MLIITARYIQFNYAIEIFIEFSITRCNRFSRLRRKTGIIELNTRPNSRTANILATPIEIHFWYIQQEYNIIPKRSSKRIHEPYRWNFIRNKRSNDLNSIHITHHRNCIGVLTIGRLWVCTRRSILIIKRRN